MKTIVQNWKRLTILASTVALLCPACASGSPALLTATTNRVATVTVTNEQIVTRTVFETNQVVNNVTNQVQQTVFTTNVVPVQVTNFTDVVTFKPSSTVTTVLQGAEAVNTVTGPVNPFSGTIAAVLALFGAGVSWYAKQKSNQVNQHLNTIQTMSTAIASLEPTAMTAYHAAVSSQATKSNAAATIQNVAKATATALNQ